MQELGLPRTATATLELLQQEGGLQWDPSAASELSNAPYSVQHFLESPFYFVHNAVFLVVPVADASPDTFDVVSEAAVPKGVVYISDGKHVVFYSGVTRQTASQEVASQAVLPTFARDVVRKLICFGLCWSAVD
jgi:hypothetical protein